MLPKPHFGDCDGDLYIYNNEDKLYRLNGKKVEALDNGTDGVIFLSDPLHQAFNYQAGSDANMVNKLIVDPINFTTSAWTQMSADEQRALFSVWLFSLFFESMLPTKPIQFFQGEKGSGKSTPRIFFKGPKARRIPLSDQ